MGFGLYWVFRFFRFFLFEQAVGKIVGWFSSSAKLLFTSASASTVDYLIICELITYWSLEAVNIKKSLIITGMTNWNWIKFDVGFCFFVGLPKKTWWVHKGDELPRNGPRLCKKLLLTEMH